MALFAILVACLTFPLTALAGGPGSTSGAFLKLPTGARAIGMGESYTAAGDDVQSMTWNPAGLARMSSRQFTFMHAEWFQGIRYESIAYAQPFANFFTVGGGIDFLFSGSLNKAAFADLSGLVYGPENVGLDSNTGGTFSASNVVLTGAGAVNVSALRWIAVPNVQAGMNLRVLLQKIDTESAANGVVDIGGMWTPEFWPNWTFGAVGQNLGPALNGKIPPFSFRLGACYRMLDRKLAISSDYYQPIDNYGRISGGAEYWYKNVIGVRGGYRFQGRVDLNKLGTNGLEGVSLGLGFKYQVMQVDYAFETLGFLGATHRVSLTVNF